MTHRGRVSKQVHLAVIPGCAEVDMVDLANVAPATTNYTGFGLGQASHLSLHFQAVVGGHGCLVEANNNYPTDH